MTDRKAERGITLDAPGLYFCAGGPDPAWETFGEPPCRIAMSGLLASRAEDEETVVFNDGILLDAHEGGPAEARRMLEEYRRGGIERMTALEGFYNVVVVDRRERTVWLVSDVASSRPWYVYRSGPVIAAAPTPLAFADLGLPMTLERQALYETVRMLHTAGERTVIREIGRIHPGEALRVDAEAEVRPVRHFTWAYRPANERTLDESADEIKDLVAECVRGATRHPLLADRPVEISLTGGMDSRHILGELIEQGCTPERIRHVDIKDADVVPVRAICEGLGIPSDIRPIADIGHEALFRRWAGRSAGLLNLHQYYLLHMMEDLPPGGVIGFDGYLMDWFLGLYPKFVPERFPRPEDYVWSRMMSSRATLRLLFPDWRAMQERGVEEARIEARRYDGPDWFKMMMLDFHRRGLHYTGTPYTMMADDAIYLAPGATRRAIEFYLGSPMETAGEKRARLASLKRHFPRLAAFPSPTGRPYTEYTSLRKSPRSRHTYVGPWLRALASGFREDPAPRTEHEWIRRIPALRRLHRRIVTGSALAEDGHLRRRWLLASWHAHRMGAYEAWTLLGVAGTEVAYRLLVRGESLDSIVSWLFAD